jgi:pyruvate dehydrogenase E2 component (dihydrolipoamide acetyltransferase)
MAVDILMPALSPGMEKGHLARWLKREGDAIAAGDVIAEIETDKATLELEASEAGILSEIVVPAGSSDVAVNKRIAVLSAGAMAPSAQALEENAAPLAADPARDAPVLIAAAPMPMAATEPSGRLFASPRARRLAGELGVDLADLSGSGPQGRILERNVRNAVAAAMARLRADVGVAAPALHGGLTAEALAPPAERNMRIATSGTVPPTYLTSHVEADALLALLERINQAAPRAADGAPGDVVTLDDLVVKAWAQALSETPDANLSLKDGEPVRHDHVDIALIDQGMSLAPVLRRTESKGIAAIAREARELAARAEAGTLQADDCAGGTTSIASVRLPGIDGIAATIRPTHTTALAYGAVEKRMIVRGDTAVPARVMTVTVSFDPRALGMATGAALVAAFRSRLEAPLRLLV